MEKYENLGLVGEGSYGMVMKCRHRESGRIVAVKKFLDSEDDKAVKKIALREIKMLKRLRHENLVSLLEVWRRRRRWFLVFEFVERTVLDELEDHPAGLDPERTRLYLYQTLRGVAFCHQHNVIHRDIKPENVLVSQGGVVKVCDFGFARTLAAPGEAYTDYVATRWYRAPELLVGDSSYGKAVDVWAVGCLFVEMLTGEPLFPGDSDIDQLYHIIRCFGNLTPRHQAVFYQNPVFSGVRLPEAPQREPLSQRCPKLSGPAIDLTQSCLQLDPDRRAPCSDLLQHQLFTHDQFHLRFVQELGGKVQKDGKESRATRRGREQGEDRSQKDPPSRTTTQPSRTTTQPSRTNTQPSTTTTQPSTTTTQPSTTTTQPSRTNTQPSTTTTQPSTTTTQPSRTNTQPSRTTFNTDLEHTQPGTTTTATGRPAKPEPRRDPDHTETNTASTATDTTTNTTAATTTATARPSKPTSTADQRKDPDRTEVTAASAPFVGPAATAGPTPEEPDPTAESGAVIQDHAPLSKPPPAPAHNPPATVTNGNGMVANGNGLVANGNGLVANGSLGVVGGAGPHHGTCGLRSIDKAKRHGNVFSRISQQSLTTPYTGSLNTQGVFHERSFLSDRERAVAMVKKRSEVSRTEFRFPELRTPQLPDLRGAEGKQIKVTNKDLRKDRRIPSIATTTSDTHALQRTHTTMDTHSNTHAPQRTHTTPDAHTKTHAFQRSHTTLDTHTNAHAPTHTHHP